MCYIKVDSTSRSASGCTRATASTSGDRRLHLIGNGQKRSLCSSLVTPRSLLYRAFGSFTTSILKAGTVDLNRSPRSPQMAAICAFPPSAAASSARLETLQGRSFAIVSLRRNVMRRGFRRSEALILSVRSRKRATRRMKDSSKSSRNRRGVVHGERVLAHSASTRRMRLHRARRRLGLRCLTNSCCPRRRSRRSFIRGCCPAANRRTGQQYEGPYTLTSTLPLWRATLGLLAVRTTRHSR